jgi:hypothetical protein
MPPQLLPPLPPLPPLPLLFPLMLHLRLLPPPLLKEEGDNVVLLTALSLHPKPVPPRPSPLPPPLPPTHSITPLKGVLRVLPRNKKARPLCYPKLLMFLSKLLPMFNPLPLPKPPLLSKGLLLSQPPL